MEQEWLDLAAELIRVASERGDVEYLEVIKGDRSIRFGREEAHLVNDGEQAAAANPARVALAPLTPAGSTRGAPPQGASGPVAPAHEVPAAGRSGPVPELAGTVLVRSPMVGAFYRAPAPGKPAFAEIGDAVTAETTIGLVETMKVFTSIRADADGTVEEIFGRDGAFIEFDQPLFRLRVA